MNFTNFTNFINTMAERPGQNRYLPHDSDRQRQRHLRQIVNGQLEMAGTQEVREAMLRMGVLRRAA
jgi:hypothetical protein